MNLKAKLPPHLSLRMLLPSIITLCALTSGLHAIRFALDARWDAAVLAIVVAAFFDVLDGRMARLLKATSKFGAELDSLSDIICFGAAPAIMLYLWGAQMAAQVAVAPYKFGWLAVVLFVLCSALRLARFNVAADEPAPGLMPKPYMIGVPTPAGAGLAILPIIAAQEWPEFASALHPKLLAAWLVIIALLMVARVRTLALKGIRFKRDYVLLVLVAAAAFIGGLVSEPWITLTLFGLGYALHLPVAAWVFKNK